MTPVYDFGQKSGQKWSIFVKLTKSDWRWILQKFCKFLHFCRYLARQNRQNLQNLTILSQKGRVSRL